MGRYDDALAAHRAVLAEAARRAGQMPPAVARAHRAHTLTLIGEIMLELRDRDAASPGLTPLRHHLTREENTMAAGDTQITITRIRDLRSHAPIGVAYAECRRRELPSEL